MTSRARTMLASLEDSGGEETRHDLWNHAGRFYHTNNAAAELRASGVEVEYDRETDTYRLLDERLVAPAPYTGAPRVNLLLPSATPHQPLVEQNGQMVLV